jgi:hypothetical protein
MPTTRKNSNSRGGGGVLGGVVSALKMALPSIVLYEALKMQGRRVAGKGRHIERSRHSKRGRGKKSKRGGGKSKKRGCRGSRRSRRGRGSRRGKRR